MFQAFDGKSETTGLAAEMPAIDLPSGGGAISGIGEKFAANPALGTGSMSVPIFSSPGRSGFGPQLSLDYDSGNGNGPFGFGWSLSLPSIRRKTDKGLPRYADGDGSDVFLLSGVEDLVPVLNDNGEHHPDRDSFPGFTIFCYRPRTEGLFSRIERWLEVETGEVHWRTISSENITNVFGKNDDSRILDPETDFSPDADLDPDADRDRPRDKRIFEWLICESFDDKGNAMVYEYARENQRNVAQHRAFEQNRQWRGQKYIKRIRYGNRTSRLLEPDLAQQQWLFEVLFDYDEDHYQRLPFAQNVPEDEQQQRVQASAQSTGNWSVRPDPFSRYRAGFEVRTYRRCVRVLMFHHFTELGREPTLVRSTEFDYADLTGGADEAVPTIVDELAHQGSTRFASFIRRTWQSGYVRQQSTPVESRGDIDYVTYLKKPLPPLEFEYSKAQIQHQVKEVDAQSLDNIPAGADADVFNWLDLDGEGLNGLLSRQGGAWQFKNNLGEARLGSLQTLTSQPSLVQETQFLDLSGNGQLDVVTFSEHAQGFYQRSLDGHWEDFNNFSHVPNLDWQTQGLRFVDLTGDGHADILMTHDDVFTWYPSLQERGFDAAHQSSKPWDEGAESRLLFADDDESIFLGDMTGDGLSDLVRIRNGQVCYWPNLGYGRFGSRVMMENGPLFDAPELFSHSRLRLADIDGSGSNDLIYLGSQGVTLFFNLLGNSWTEAYDLPFFPQLDNVSTVAPLDLLGNGTACLVWSSWLAGDAGRHMRYVDLMGGQKPHLLTKTVNNMGAETHVSYAPSTKFYLQDKQQGKPWITKLPFPVHVVERVETYDRISNNRFVTRYSYHHGYFDGVEREFRGFGLVQQWDTEEFSALQNSAQFPTGNNIDASSHVPPVLTKTWYHTGVYLGRGQISNYFAGLRDAHDQGEYFREPGSNDAQAKALLLNDTHLPQGLTPDEEREACRVLRGAQLRQEVYSLDGSDQQDLPYVVTEHSYQVKQLQARQGNAYGVFVMHAKEDLQLQYERILQPILNNQLIDAEAAQGNPDVVWQCDPRISHNITLEVDDFNNVLKSVTIGYGRRWVDPAVPDTVQEQQGQSLITFHQVRVTNNVDEPGAYRTPQIYDNRVYELTGYVPTGQSGRYQITDFVQSAANAVALFDEELTFEMAPTRRRQRRLLQHGRTVFRRNDLSSPLALGQLQSMGLPYEQYQLAMTPGLVNRVFNEQGDRQRVTEQILGGADAASGRYVHSEDEQGLSDANWWVPGGMLFFSPDRVHLPEQELDYAREHFFLPHRKRDPFHTNAASTESFLSYDGYDLLPQETVDALGNRTTVGERHLAPEAPLVRHGHNYRVLQAELLMDPNRNCSAVAFDALGQVVGSAVMGKPETADSGDNLDGAFQADLTPAQIRRFFADPKGPSSIELLAGATSRHIIDTQAYYRGVQSDEGVPVVSASLARETHVANTPDPAALKVQVHLSYSDGFAREVQRKVQAEAGPVPLRDETGNIVMGADNQPVMAEGEAPRWLGSGWQVFNNKGETVRQFEPFFSDRHEFEFALKIGVSPVLFYDPLMRVVTTLHPDHRWEKVLFTPWQQVLWDASDTVLLGNPSMDPDVGDYFVRLPDSAYLPGWHDLRTHLAHLNQFQARYPDAALRADEQAAARQSEVYAATPVVNHADPLGRTLCSVAHNQSQYSHSPQVNSEFYTSFIELDITGKQRRIIDAKNRSTVTYEYDQLGNIIREASMEAGQRWMLNDVAGKPLYGWDNRLNRIRTGYDVLQRQQGIYLLEQDPQLEDVQELLLGRSVYGESRLVPEQSNLRGQLVEQFDQSGLTRYESFDFKGNALNHFLSLAESVAINGQQEPAYRHKIDWQDPDVVLSDERFTNLNRFDALNRPVQVIPAHSTQPGSQIHVIQPRYNEANLLEANDVWLQHNNLPDDLLDAQAIPPSGVGIENIDYDAKAQRQSITYKNGVTTQYQYDPQTYRLKQMRTTGEGPQALLQNLHYTYDIAGNISHIRDTAQQTSFFANARVAPSSTYTYDALFRLIEATGREFLGQPGGAPAPWSYNDAPRAGRAGIPHPNDGQALGRYLERYIYDEVGNIDTLRHVGSDWQHPGWTRQFTYSEPSLLEPEKFSNRLTRTQVGDLTSHYSVGGNGYDAHGNMLQMEQLQELRWNHLDQLHMTRRQAVGAADADGQLKQGERTWYVYGPNGQRIRKVTELNNGQIKDEWLYLNGFDVYRKPGANLQRETLHMIDDTQRIALVEMRTQGEEPGIPARLIRYQLGNHLGSAAMELDEQARLLSYEEYTPYGSTAYQAVGNQLQTPKRYRFTGMERDEESGLSYHSVRYYAPWLARWTSTDAVHWQGGNHAYGYVNGQPLALVDPSGRDGKDWQGGSEWHGMINTGVLFGTHENSFYFGVSGGNGYYGKHGFAEANVHFNMFTMYTHWGQVLPGMEGSIGASMKAGVYDINETPLTGWMGENVDLSLEIGVTLVEAESFDQWGDPLNLLAHTDQRLGFINVNAGTENEFWEFSMYNDGALGNFLLFGGGTDQFRSAGGEFSYNNRDLENDGANPFKLGIGLQLTTGTVVYDRTIDVGIYDGGPAKGKVYDQSGLPFEDLSVGAFYLVGGASYAQTSSQHPEEQTEYGLELRVGWDAEWIRHNIQNRLIHDLLLEGNSAWIAPKNRSDRFYLQGDLQLNQNGNTRRR